MATTTRAHEELYQLARDGDAKALATLILDLQAAFHRREQDVQNGDGGTFTTQTTG